MTIEIAISKKDQDAIAYAVKRLAELGHIALSDIELSIETFTAAISKVSVSSVGFGYLSSLNEHYIKAKNLADIENISIKGNGHYRQFEKRDKRKNFRN